MRKWDGWIVSIRPGLESGPWVLAAIACSYCFVPRLASSSSFGFGFWLKSNMLSIGFAITSNNLADTFAAQPVVFDEAQNRGLIRQRMIDEVRLCGKASHQQEADAGRNRSGH